MQYVRADLEKIVSEHEEDFMEEAKDKRSSPRPKQTNTQTKTKPETVGENHST